MPRVCSEDIQQGVCDLRIETFLCIRAVRGRSNELTDGGAGAPLRHGVLLQCSLERSAAPRRSRST